MTEEKRLDQGQEMEEAPAEAGQGDESGRESQEAPSVEELQRALEAKDEELQQCKDRMLRLAAELDNFKKRVEREKEEHMKYALEAFAKELLPFLDNLERAVASARENKDLDALLEGLELSLSGYLKTLERFGLQVFAAEGQRFDPNLHEALSVEESHEVEENTVIKELLKGYKLHERVIRPALVVVSKRPTEGSGQGEKSV